jgi:hypothetical protein
LNDNLVDDAESTDVSKAGEGFSPAVGGTKAGAAREGLQQSALYDWSEVAYLFEDGTIPQELLAITDPIEYNYLLVRLKKEFNEKHRSDYLRYMHLDLPYHSRRDELGGVISVQDWGAFVRRLNGVIDRVKKKRRRIVRRRKKKGKKLMPRATLFKPPKGEKLDKNPLWKEVFMRESSDEDDYSGSEREDEEVFTMYRDTLLTKGIKTQSKTAHQLAKNQANRTSENFTAANHDLTLPPIDAHRLPPQPQTGKKKKPSLNNQSMQMDRRSGSRNAGPAMSHKKLSVQTNAVGSGLGVPAHLLAKKDGSKSRGESRKKGLKTAA